MAANRAPTPPPEPEAEPEEDDVGTNSGEWARALYDFASTVSVHPDIDAHLQDCINLSLP